MITTRGMARLRAGAAIAACGAAVMLALTGCSSGTAAPPWAASLGPGVTVVAPAAVSPGNDSPGAVLTGQIAASSAKTFAAICPYWPPKIQAECRRVYGSKSPGQVVGGTTTYRNFAVGYTAIDGTKALVGLTGTFCNSSFTPKCATNNDPAAIFSDGKPFASLWRTTIAQLRDLRHISRYKLVACVKIGGKWYGASSSS